MQDPNKRQVGGDHYKSEYEHWDFVLDCNLGYLDGVATKYLTRWRKAAKPVQDLQKALHYVEKMINTHRVCFPRLRAPHSTCLYYLHDFTEANQLQAEDAAIIAALCVWETVTDLALVVKKIQRLLNSCDLPMAKPVPVEDSNRHALQVVDED